MISVQEKNIKDRNNKKKIEKKILSYEIIFFTFEQSQWFLPVFESILLPMQP